MVALVVTILLAVLLVAVLFYFIDWAGLSGPLAQIVKLAIVIAAIVIIIQRAGVL